MVVEEEAMESRACGKSIMVGIPMDEEGRDLLNWAIEEIAEAGDRVVALHVYRKSDLCNTSILSITSSLDGFLAEYEDYCGAKQVAIEGRLAEGKSIKKVLVKEAQLCGAEVVVVGVNKNTVFRISAPLGKYCAKKLPPAVGLYAVHGGKIILQRRPAMPHTDPSTAESLQQKGDATKITKSASSREKKVYSHSSSLSIVKPKPQDRPLGWPLLRRAATVGAEPSRSQLSKCQLERKMSVVQWAMSLPDRYQSSTGTEFSSDMEQSPHGDGMGHVYAELHKELEMILENDSLGCQWFTQTELENWTNQFSSENLIGNGGSSRVYRGLHPDGPEIAVKMTKLSEESFRDFLMEANIITSLNHEHIIHLKGVSVNEDELISVYNHFSRGSLEENLHGKKSKPPLQWAARTKVAIGIAEALNYIHNGCPQSVIHRDVKSSNILLSEDFESQLSDFGLAIWAPKNSSYIIQNDVVGTFGYLAPEYFMYGKVSDKVDVYSFGVVLLELLTGRKPINAEVSKNEESLVMWVTKILLEKGDLMNLLDPNLEANYDEGQMHRMVVAATTCIRRVARLRPQMNEVLSLLRGEQDVKGWIQCHTNEEEVDDHQDEEAYPPSSVASHLGVALQDVDDTASFSSTEPNYYNSIEEYLKGRWSRSSSFD